MTQQQQLNQYYINGNLAYKLFSKPEASAVYCLLAYYCSSKYIIYKNTTKHKKLCEVAAQIGIGKSTLLHQIEVLKVEGIIEENKKERYLKILSNKEITEKYGLCKSIYASAKLDYKQLKLFFKNIQFYSNISQQRKQIEKKQHLNTIIGKFHFGVQTKAETNKLKKFEQRCNVSFNGDVGLMYKTLNLNEELTLSTKSHAKLLNRKSHMTAFNHKRKLSEQDERLSFARQYSKKITCSRDEHFEMLSTGELPPYAKRRDGKSYYDLANKITFNKDLTKPKDYLTPQNNTTNKSKTKKGQIPGERYLADTHNLIG